MIPKKYYPFVMNFWNTLFMTVIMTTVFTLYNTGTISLLPFLNDIWRGFLIGYIVSIIVPVGKMGQDLTAKLGATPGSVKYALLSAIPPTVVMVIVMCFAFTFFAIGLQFGAMALIMGALSSMPLGFVVAYLCGVLLTPVSMKLAEKMTR